MAIDCDLYRLHEIYNCHSKDTVCECGMISKMYISSDMSREEKIGVCMYLAKKTDDISIQFIMQFYESAKLVLMETLPYLPDDIREKIKYILEYI